MDGGEILNRVVEIMSSMDWGEIGFGVIEIIASLFSFSVLITLWERRYTTKRLKKYVSNYLTSLEFEWQNQTAEFALMHRVRAFELLLRNVRVMQPTTPLANKRVQEVRDAVEFFHTGGIPVFRGEHLRLPNTGEFPVAPNDATEALVREHVLKKLRAIKWLNLQGSAVRSKPADAT